MRWWWWPSSWFGIHVDDDDDDEHCRSTLCKVRMRLATQMSLMLRSRKMDSNGCLRADWHIRRNRFWNLLSWTSLEYNEKFLPMHEDGKVVGIVSLSFESNNKGWQSIISRIDDRWSWFSFTRRLGSDKIELKWSIDREIMSKTTGLFWFILFGLYIIILWCAEGSHERHNRSH